MSPQNAQDDIMPYSPDAKNECVWHENGIEDHLGLHKFLPYPPAPKKILDNILEAIGQTPLVKLNKIPQSLGIECDVYAKVEFLNAGGSIKDRIAVRMVEIAEEEGRLKPGMTIIEPTSGNTGIGLALVAAVKGYDCTIVLPEKMSHEKIATLQALGANIIRTPNDAKYDSEESHIGRAFKLHRELPDSIVLDQYINCGNPLTHYESTAAEIIDSLGGRVPDMVVIGVGTGGTVSGVATRFQRESEGKCQVVGVDPVGSVISGGGKSHHFEVEGIGYDFVPTVLDRSLINQWASVEDRDTFRMARRLNAEEGILSGGSSGAALHAAMQFAKPLKKGQVCVVVLPDGVRNYLTKYLSDDWMIQHGFATPDELTKEAIKPREDSCVKSIFDNYDPEKPGSEYYQQCEFVPGPRDGYSPTRRMLLDNILQAIGYTPLVRLNKLPQSLGIESQVLAKCEFMSAGGSIKDRIALRMVELAEEKGALKPGMTVIEPTSGNTGVGLALVCAVKGYRCIIVMPVKMSQEKEATLKSLGAIVVRTPNASHDQPESLMGVALRLTKEIPGAIMLDQYRNAGNPLAHYENTAEEILWATEGKVDYVVVGAGTGGSVTGIGRKLKERVPNVKVIGVDPVGSILSDPKNITTTSPYEVEGTGYDFVPASLKYEYIDGWVKTTDADSFHTARRLIREEGILCGGSSGANVWAALQVAKKLDKSKRVVVILPDSIRNYMTKFVDDGWMKAKGFPIPEYK